MASFLQFLLLFSLSLHLVFVSADDQSSEAQTGTRTPPIIRPNKLVLKVQKDGATNLHVAQIFKRTPRVLVPFVVDLNGRLLWVNCENKYLSSTYNAPICHSAQCSRAGSHTCRTCSSKLPTARPGCHVNACGVVAVNPITQQSAMGELAQDVLSIPSTLGSTPGPMVTVPQFLFACAPSTLLQKGLPKNVQGIAGLGHTQISLPTQLASNFGIPLKIAVCLASGPSQNGVIFFGDGPYNMLPGIDVSRRLTYAPLSIGQQGEYLINIQSIQINKKVVPLTTTRRSNQAMLSTAIYRSGFKCKKCDKSYSSKDIYLDLTVTAGLKQYVEVNPARTELFRSPLVSFLYERGWRQNFSRSGFPGPDEEFKMAQDYFKSAEGGVLVDVSCGSGLFSRKFAKSGIYSAVVALDFSENMLRQCYDFLKRDATLLATNLALVRADVSRLPFASGSVDAVHAGAALHCWPSPSNAVAEITRVLRSGGVFVGTTFLQYTSSTPWYIRPFRERIAQSYSYLTEEEIQDLCASCGLTNYSSKVQQSFIMFSAQKP